MNNTINIANLTAKIRSRELSNIVAMDLGAGCNSVAVMTPGTREPYILTLNDPHEDQSDCKVIHSSLILPKNLTEEEIKQLKTLNNISPKLEERIFIGFPAKESAFDSDLEQFQYFKHSPKDWDRRYSYSTHWTYKELMGIFLFKLYCTARSMAERDDNKTEILKAMDPTDPQSALLVGCPSSPDWTEHHAEYEALIAKATGFAENAVAVIPESLAALMVSLQSSSEAKISLASGVMVIDLGCLSVDITYFRLSKDGSVMMLRSTESAGGQDYDRSMLRCILKQEHERLSAAEEVQSYINRRMSEFTPALIDLLTDDARIQKEQASLKLASKVPFKFGGRVTISEGLSFDRNQALQDALDEPYILINSNEATAVSWHSRLLAFLIDAKNALNNEGLPLGAVALTGGMSNLPFVKNIVREAFGQEITVIQDPRPDRAVSSGLCYLGYRLRLMQEKLPDLERKLRYEAEQAELTFRDKLIVQLSKAYERFLKSELDKPEDIKLSEFNKRISQQFKYHTKSIQYKQFMDRTICSLYIDYTDLINSILNDRTLLASFFPNVENISLFVNNNITFNPQDNALNVRLDTEDILTKLRKGIEGVCEGSLLLGFILLLVGFCCLPEGAPLIKCGLTMMAAGWAGSTAANPEDPNLNAKTKQKILVKIQKPDFIQEKMRESISTYSVSEMLVSSRKALLDEALQKLVLTRFDKVM